VTVKVGPAGGTATSPADFTVAPAVVTFAAGETSKFVTINVVDDPQDEPDETVKLKLVSPANATVGRVGTFAYTIQNHDPARTVEFDTAAVTVSEAAGTVLLTVRLSAAARFPVTVAYAVDGGTATAGQDFKLSGGTLTFKPGETEKTFVVRIVNDTRAEPTETVRVRLSAPANAVLGSTDVLTLSIQDDD
jgi:hypothetical protein